jgi:hypothetical protein
MAGDNVYVTYFDRLQGRDNYLVAGLVIPMDQIGTIEAQITALSKELFGSSDLEVNTEFHADFIYRGRRNFKGRSMADRASIIGRLAKIIGEECVYRKSIRRDRHIKDIQCKPGA